VAQSAVSSSSSELSLSTSACNNNKIRQGYKKGGEVSSPLKRGVLILARRSLIKKEMKRTFDVEDVPGGRNMTARMQTSWKTPPK